MIVFQILFTLFHRLLFVCAIVVQLLRFLSSFRKQGFKLVLFLFRQKLKCRYRVL